MAWATPVTNLVCCLLAVLLSPACFLFFQWRADPNEFLSECRPFWGGEDCIGYVRGGAAFTRGSDAIEFRTLIDARHRVGEVVTPDGRRFIAATDMWGVRVGQFGSVATELSLFDAEGREMQRLTHDEWPEHSIAIAPGGSVLYFLRPAAHGGGMTAEWSDEKLCALDLRTNSQRVFEIPGAMTWIWNLVALDDRRVSVEFEQDFTRRWAIVDFTSPAGVLNPAGPEWYTTCTAARERFGLVVIGDPAFDQSGEPCQSLVVWSSSDARRRRVAANFDAIRGLAFSPLGNKLLFSGTAVGPRRSRPAVWVVDFNDASVTSVVELDGP